MAAPRTLTRKDGPRLAALIDRRRASMDPPLGVKSIGISSNTLAGWRAGDTLPRRDALAKVAAALRWTVEHLLALLDDPDLPLDPPAAAGRDDLLGSIHFLRDGRIVIASDLPADEQLKLAAIARAALAAVNQHASEAQL